MLLQSMLSGYGIQALVVIIERLFSEVNESAESLRNRYQ